MGEGGTREPTLNEMDSARPGREGGRERGRESIIQNKLDITTRVSSRIFQ